MPPPAAAGEQGNGPIVDVNDRVVCRPFIDAEWTTAFESQQIPRPVLEWSAGAPDKVKLLDPAAKYKTKKEWTQRKIHWFPPDEESLKGKPAKMDDITTDTATDMAKHIFDGFNTISIVAGHQKSGKTTVFLGDTSEDAPPSAAGLVPRFGHALFKQLSEKPSNSSTEVHLEMVAVDDAHGMHDLIGGRRGSVAQNRHVDPEPLKVKEDANGVVSLTGVQRTTVSHPDDFLAAVKSAFSRYKKVFRPKGMNHFALLVNCEETLTFSDEKQADAMIKKTSQCTATLAFIEGRPVTVTRCVDAAASKERGDNPQAKVPVRDSSITRILQGFFGANAYAAAFTCVGPYWGTAKDALFWLDFAKQMSSIRTRPRQSYDHKTSEFRRLDQEVNELRGELNEQAAAQEIVQKELDRRHKVMLEAKAVHDEQQMAVSDLKSEATRDDNVTKVKRMRVVRVNREQEEKEDAIRAEIKDAQAKVNDFETQYNAQKTAMSNAVAGKAAAESDGAKLDQRATAAREKVAHFESRYAEVELSKQGLGAVRAKMADQHAKRMVTKPAETEALRRDAEKLEAEGQEVAAPLRVAQLAANQIKDGQKRLKDAQRRPKELEEEKKRLEKENAELEEELIKLRKDAEPESGCCVVM